MVSHLSNGALRASLTSTARACCSASISVSTGSRVTPRRPRPRSATPYSSYALACETHHGAQPHSQWQWQSLRSRSGASLRGYATAAEPQLAQDIAVLGGGLTGLTTAYYLACFHPAAKITIYEAEDRLGGWIDTERVEIKTQEGKTATISFERGARAVSPQTALMRWEDFVLYDLVRQSPPHSGRTEELLTQCSTDSQAGSPQPAQCPLCHSERRPPPRQAIHLLSRPLGGAPRLITILERKTPRGALWPAATWLHCLDGTPFQRFPSIGGEYEQKIERSHSKMDTRQGKSDGKAFNC